MTARCLDYLRQTTADAYERALRSLDITVTLDAMFRGSARGNQHQMMLSCDATIAGTVKWILRREDRIVLAAHNGVHHAPLASWLRAWSSVDGHQRVTA